MKILHLITWWTISWNVPEYKEIEKLANIFMDNVDIWKYIIYSMQADCNYSFITVCKKDSRDILNIDRKRMVDEILKNYSTWIKSFLITHWTYTMPETGKFLEENIPNEILYDISIIITWAMYPWNLLWSDAPMNIWASISSLLNTRKSLWVKICMHWRNWNVNNIQKDEENLLFKLK